MINFFLQFAARRILQLARQLVDVKKDDGFSALHLAALNGHSQVCEVLVKEGQADVDIRNDRRQTPFLLAVSQGHAAAVEKLVDLGCDIIAKDEDGDNAMHLTIIKKANLVQEVPQHEAPKIYEIYQHLGHIQEHRLMYTLLCYLAQEGCKMEPNYKGARIFDWIPEPDIRDLILNYEKKGSAAQITNNAGGSNDCNQSRDMTELYNNIEMMNLTSQDSTTISSTLEQDNSGGSSSMANCATTTTTTTTTTNNSSNPPTPARRNRNNNATMNNNNNPRDAPTPPPAIATSSTSSSSSSAAVAVAITEDEKKLNTEIRNLPRNHTTSPPLPHAEPTTSSNTQSSSAIITNSIDTIASSNSPNRNTSQSPPLPMSSKHISRKQQQQQKGYPTPQPYNGKPQLQAPQECIVCNDICLLVTFDPCGHQVCCEDCALRMKKCLSCQSVIDKRYAMNGKLLLPKENQRQPSADRLRYLEHKILEIEETHSCGICMERRRNVAFLCGHSACSKCAETLKTCHM